MPPVAGLLYKARRYLSGRHWIKHILHNGKGGVCALGALLLNVTMEDPMYFQAKSYLEQTLPEGFPRSVAEFNDRKSTHKADILALYDRAIIKALEKGE